jgi:hypothetical protein
MQHLALTCVVALACGGSNRPPPAPSKDRPATAHAPTPLAQARAYERGDGVPRDYANAATIYEQQCASGTGDLVACRKLLRALLNARGVNRDLERAIPLARTLCDTRSDGQACLLVAFSDGNPSEKDVATLEALAAQPCDKQHLDRCELPRDPFSWFSQSGSVQFEDRRFDDQGCKLGVLEACERLRYAEGEEHDRAMAKLDAACDKGDADACDVVDRPIAATILCKAHDYDACAALGCAGDADAAQIAADHGAPAACDRRQSRTTPPVATGITPSDVPVFDSVGFSQLERTELDRTLRYQISNRGTKPIDTFIGEVYGYDAAGKQVERHHVEFREGLQPGEATTLEIERADGESFEPCVEVIRFGGENQSHLARCPARKAKGARWGDGRDNVELQINFDGIPLADDWIGTLEPTLAEPFEQTHPGIRVRDVSGSPALMMPSAAWDLTKLSAETPTIQIPLVRQPTAIAYRVTGVDDLQLSPATLAKIFQGQITSWADPAIAKDNPGKSFPSIPIVVFQETSQDDQLRLTTYLTTAARRVWKLGATKQGAFHEGNKFVRSYDIAREVASQEGAIAFVGAGLAEKANMRVARIKNARGVFVAPTSDAVTRGDYPIVSSRALFVRINHNDQATVDAARAYATWLATDALPIFERIGFGLEPEAVRRAGLAKLDSLTVGILIE